MYSFRERSDTTVVDEPLYAHYLSTTGIWHPGRDEVLATQNSDGAAVVANEILGTSPTPVIFFKQMAHHLVGMDWSFLDRVHNVILTRHPASVLASFIKNVTEVDADTTGLPICVRLLDRILEAGTIPIVVDSRELLTNPTSVLSQLCAALGLDFDERMLSWEPGPIPEDGSWAVHWHESTHRSTGFAPYVPKKVTLPEQVRSVVDECMPMYERLVEYALKADG